jgi:hypothetical protein
MASGLGQKQEHNSVLFFMILAIFFSKLCIYKMPWLIQ